MIDLIQRNYELHQQAIAKAKRLDDGSIKGGLKAELILMLDDLRTHRDVRIILEHELRRLDKEETLGSEPNLSARQAFTERLEESIKIFNHARDRANEIIKALEAFGVTVKLKRTDEYR